MAGIDELIEQIPVADLAAKVGADQAEVSKAIQTLVPALVGGVQQNVIADDIDSSELESDIAQQGASDLLEGGISVDQVDATQGNHYVARIFGGNDSGQVASALANAGVGGDLVKKLLPLLAPIVLAYVGKQFSQNNSVGTQAQGGGGGLGDLLGGILGGAASGGGGAGNNPLGSILGSVLGGKHGGAIGDILGGMLGGKR